MRVLPADVYDTLEFSALMYRGIGRDSFFSGTGKPLCVYGHGALASALAEHEEPRYAEYSSYKTNPIGLALRDAGIGYNENDGAVAAINRRKRCSLIARVPFKEWCAELGVERGES